MTREHIGFIGITVGLFLVLFVSPIFQHGLFFDGLIYSSVSNNLANGIGSFWQPQFSTTIYAQFYEHPPLVFGLEALFMRVFDGAFYAEKLFSFFTACSVVLLIIAIWRKIVPTDQLKKLVWLPVFFWIITPKNSWAFTNNLLDNMLAVFTLLSIYLLLIAIQKQGLKRFVYLLFSGVAIGLAFLSKGPPGLFPLGFLLLYYLVNRKSYQFRKMLLDSLILFGAVILFFLLLFLVSDAAFIGLSNYLDVQVIASLEGKSRTGSRLVLMKNLLFELIPLLIVTVLFLSFYWKKMKSNLVVNSTIKKQILLFVGVGFSASVPLMISPKLSSFYLISALPYFAIAFALFLAMGFIELVEAVKKRKSAEYSILTLGILAPLFAVFLTISSANKVARDKDLIHDLFILKTAVENDIIISADPTFNDDWTTIAYLQRYNQIHIDRSGVLRNYHLGLMGRAPLNGYIELDLKLEKYSLFQRIAND